MTDDPWAINASAGAPAYTAAELRRLSSVLMMGGHADRFGTRQGVNPSGSQAVTLSGTTITVQHTRAVVYPALTTTAGPYTVALQSETHTLTAADGTNPRKDIVVLRVEDTDEDSSGFRRARSQYIVGTPAGSPSEPAVPSGSFRMATIDVPAGGSPAPTLTYNAPYVVALGGILPARNVSELPSVGLHEGAYADQGDVNSLLRYSGSAWEVMATVPETTSSGATAATNWSVSAFNATKWGPIIVGLLSFARTGADITPDSAGNITDTLAATLPSGWRPSITWYAACGDGFSDGEARIDTDGTVTLRSWIPGGVVTTGRTLRLSFCYPKA